MRRMEGGHTVSAELKAEIEQLKIRLCQNGIHCNHSWSHDKCCWCGKEWGEVKETACQECEVLRAELKRILNYCADLYCKRCRGDKDAQDERCPSCGAETDS